MDGRHDVLRFGYQPPIMLAASHLQDLEREIAQGQAAQRERGTGVPLWRRWSVIVLKAIGGRVWAKMQERQTGAHAGAAVDRATARPVEG